MRLKHLGDALDHWKGSVVGRLSLCLRNLGVVPMPTDQDHWDPKTHGQTYARLLGVVWDQVFWPKSSISLGSREQYFTELGQAPFTDLFLDPDTGIRDRPGLDPRYVYLREMRDLLNTKRDRLLLVYQHSQPYNMQDSMLNRLPAIKGVAASSFAYWAGSVSMVFVSFDHERLQEVKEVMLGLLGPTARQEGDRPARLVGL